MTKPIPTLAQYIGDGARADGFEEWVRTHLYIDAEELPGDKAALFRLIRIFAIAACEGGRIETDRGRAFGLTCADMAFAAGVSVAAAIISVCDRTDMKLARLIAEELRRGVVHSIRSNPS